MTTTPQFNLQTGDVLVGKYIVERILGQGGMGVVVDARHAHLGELYAIKIMLPEMLESEEAVGRFLREAQSSARLRGEHVARVHDVGTLENGIPYMVLEYLEGTDLDKQLNERNVLGVGEASAYLVQVCEALVEAHGQGIVHRDLKPANLFLTKRANGTACIKVLDFGISKDVAAADKISAKLTKTGAIMGSPHYMSPEQMVDSKNVDTRSDIWALGVILYELVTGTMPFNAETMPEIIAKVLSLEPRPPSQVRAGIPVGFDAVVTRCIEKNRDRRYQTVKEFMDALRPFANEGDTRPAGPLLLGPATMSPAALRWGQETVTQVQSGAVAPSGTSLSGRVGLMAVVVGAVALVIVALVVMQSKSTERQAQAAQPVPEVGSAKSAASVLATTEGVPSAATSIPAASASSSAPAATTAPAAPPNTSVLLKPPPQPSASATTTNKVKKKVKGFDE